MSNRPSLLSHSLESSNLRSIYTERGITSRENVIVKSEKYTQLNSFNSLFLVKLRPEIEIPKLKFELTLSASFATQQLCVSPGERIPKVWKVDASRLQKEEKGGGSKVVDRCRRSERKFFFCGRCNRLHPRILFLSTLPVFIRIHI